MTSRTLDNVVIPSEYRIHLKIDPRKSNFHGEVTMSLIRKNEKGTSVSAIYLHLENAAVACATLGDYVLRVSYEKEVGAVKLVPEGPVDVAEAVKLPLHLVYVGKIQTIRTYEDATRGLFKTNFMRDVSGASDGLIAATHCQPQYAHHIIPCIDEVDHKAHFELCITTQRSYSTVSNTEIVSTDRIEEQKMKTVKFARTPLMTASLFAFALGDFETISSEAALSRGKIPLTVYAAQEVKYAAYALDVIRQYLPLLEDYFGVKYPLEKLDLVLLPFLKDLAMENFGMITVQQEHLLLEPSHLANPSIRMQAKQLIVHELVHQWMGNFISFNSWEHLWFNESFATWCACEIISKHEGVDYWSSEEYLTQLFACFEKDADGTTPSISSSSMKGSIVETSDALDPHNYSKGIALLRSLSQYVGNNEFKNVLAKVFNNKDFHTRAITPSALWVCIDQNLPAANVSEVMKSWIDNPGFPLLHVTVQEGRTKLEQQPYCAATSHEDEKSIFFIPLFLMTNDCSKSSELLTTQSMEIDKTVVTANSGFQGYYRVSYDSSLSYDLIYQHISERKLSGASLLQIFEDLKAFIGDARFQKSWHIDGFFSLMDFISRDMNAEEYEQYFPAVAVALQILEKIELGAKSFGNLENKFDFLNSFILPMFRNLKFPKNPKDLVKFGNGRLEVMSRILFMGAESDEVYRTCSNYFKSIYEGPKNALPIEILDGILTTVMRHATSLKQWKKYFELTKCSPALAAHVAGANPEFIHKAALEHLGFSLSPELLRKVLNFVTTNFKSVGVTKALFGLRYNAREKCGDVYVRDLMWDWFLKNFDLWAKKSLNSSFESANQMRLALSDVSVIAFGMWVDEPAKIDSFIASKETLYANAINLIPVWSSIKANEEIKKIIFDGLMECKL
ncbi:LAMI_0C10352g1_1 [Lachancea mirantina]|uniref:Aminopeptidase n=1 Tax=Lachancea mirantina TaxID=1230905 RepID=A0A1G4J624_9SACH|nr:LAMI_0C10352g1_1 [Lachancea mirantina]